MKLKSTGISMLVRVQTTDGTHDMDFPEIFRKARIQELKEERSREQVN